MDLDKSVLQQIVSEQLSDARLNAEDSLLGRSPQVHYTVVQSSLHQDSRSNLLALSLQLLHFLLIQLIIVLVILQTARSILDLEWQLARSPRNNIDSSDGQLHLLAATQNLLLRLSYHGIQVHY